MKHTLAIIAVIVASLALAAGAMAAPAPVASSAAMVTDPAGDVVGASRIDLTEFSVTPSKTHISYGFTFNGEFAEPSRKVSICVATGRGLACIVPGRQAIRFLGKNYPATISRTADTLNVSVRSKSLGYASGDTIKARGRTSLTTGSDPCAATCIDLTLLITASYTG